jgi:phosphoribosyl-ATP pyrophosphohydrolase
MALYQHRIELADALAAPLKSDRPDALWPTVVTDTEGVCLGLAYSSRESLRRAVESRRGVYHSRRRGIWIKGESSGATQELVRVDLDCDRDTLRFVVRQAPPGFCHREQATCWGEASGIAALEQTIARRMTGDDPKSYTRRLLMDPQLLSAKIVEEAAELASAVGPGQAAAETADLIYFALVQLAAQGGRWSDVTAELDRRRKLVTRRSGDAKPK